MLRFAHPEYLYFFAVIPVMLAIFLFMQLQKKKAVARMGEPALLKKLSPDASSVRPWLKGALASLGLILLITGLANPQIGTKLEEVKREGVDIIIALDVSNSMRPKISGPTAWSARSRPFRGLSTSLKTTGSASWFSQARRMFSCPLPLILAPPNYSFLP
jgi:Ca-activated chloride channel family protein